MTPHDAADQQEEEHRFMTVTEVAAELRVSRATVYRLLHAGALPGRRFGKTLRVPRDAVAAYIDDSATGHP